MALVPLVPQITDGTANADISLGMRQGKRKIQRYHIDDRLARQIFRMFYEKEPIIDVCKEHRYSYTFRGLFSIIWGGGDITPITLNSDHERDELETLFKRALDYRDMFGMVPMKFRPKGRASAGKPSMYIPPFGSGRFILEYDPVNLGTEVVYEVLAPQHPHRTGDNRQRNRPVTKVLDVFVWPGHEPDIVSQKFRSKIAGLMEQYVENRELHTNLLDADWRLAHPVLITQARPDSRSLQELTEEEAFGAPDDASIMGARERNSYNRDVHRAIRTETTAAEMNAASMSGVATQRGANRHSVDPNTMLMMPGQRAATWDGGLYNIPHGEEMAKGISPQSRSDLMALQILYEETVCLAMGTPRAFITGGVSAARAKGDTDHLRAIVRTAVLKDRADINLFYTWAYEKVNRRADDDMMVHALLAADIREDKLGADQSPDERKRIASIRANISKIAAMPYRTRVVFQEDPLPQKVELPVIAAAVNAGALSKLELVNLLRAEVGINTIDQDHELIRGENADTTPATVEILPTAANGAAQRQPSTTKSKEPEKKKKKEEPKEPDEKKKKKDSEKPKPKAKAKTAGKKRGAEKEEKKEPAKKKRRKD